MTGVLNAMVGGGGKFVYSVTVVNIQGITDLYGFNDSSGPPNGSISPTTFRGATIRTASSRGGGQYDFSISIDGVLAQNYLQSVLVEATDGTLDLYRQEDASSFIDGPITSVWSWGSGSDRSWTSDSPSPRAIVIAF